MKWTIIAPLSWCSVHLRETFIEVVLLLDDLPLHSSFIEVDFQKGFFHWRQWLCNSHCKFLGSIGHQITWQTCLAVLDCVKNLQHMGSSHSWWDIPREVLKSHRTFLWRVRHFLVFLKVSKNQYYRFFLRILQYYLALNTLIATTFKI